MSDTTNISELPPSRYRVRVELYDGDRIVEGYRPDEEAVITYEDMPVSTPADIEAAAVILALRSNAAIERYEGHEEPAEPDEV